MVEYLSKEQQRYIDLEGGLSRVRGNLALYLKLLRLFALGQDFDQFEDAIKNGAIDSACNIIHGIKGLSGNLSLSLLFDVCATLNKQLKDGIVDEGTLENYRAILTETKAIIEQFLSKAST